MKICLIGLTSPFRGGIAHHTALLYQTLQKQRHTVKLLGFKHQYPRWLFPGKTQNDLSHIQLNLERELTLSPLNPFSWWRTFEKIREFQPEWVLFQWWNPFFGPALGTVSRLCQRLENTQTAFFCHNVTPHERTPFGQILTRYGLAKAHYCLVHCDEELKKLRRLRFSCVAQKIDFLPFSLPQSENVVTQEEAQKRLGLSGPALLFFGHVRPYKGLGVLLEAMPLVLQQIPCTLLIAGEFYEDKRKYLQQIDSLSLGEHVQIIDYYIPNEEVHLYFAAADVVLLPYLSATQSAIVSLAYSYHKPVIATRVGGIPELVEEGKTGFLVRPDQPRELAEAIIRFYEIGGLKKFIPYLAYAQASLSHKAFQCLEPILKMLGVDCQIHARTVGCGNPTLRMLRAGLSVEGENGLLG